MMVQYLSLIHICALTREGKERMIELALRCRHARAGRE